MDIAKRRGKKQMKKPCKARLKNGEVTEIRTEMSAKEDKEAIEQNQMGKCPGHSGIKYEFWKSWKAPKKNNDDKEPIIISSIIQSVFNDIERHGIEDEAYTKGIMSLIFKK